MRVHLGSDHAGFELKGAIARRLVELGHEPVDHGPEEYVATDDYPPYVLDKIASKKFVDSGSPAVDLVKNFQWTEEDQNSVARSIAVDGMSDDEAAKKFIDAHPQLVAKWLAGTGAENAA